MIPRWLVGGKKSETADVKNKLCQFHLFTSLIFNFDGIKNKFCFRSDFLNCFFFLFYEDNSDFFCLTLKKKI